MFVEIIEGKLQDISPFSSFTRHGKFDLYFLSHRFFELPLPITGTCSILIFYEQIAIMLQMFLNNIAGFDVGFEEFEELCREARRIFATISKVRA